MHIYREHPYEKLTIHAWTDSNFEFAPHWHSELEIVYVISGTLQAQINGTVCHLNEGDILLCGTNDIHSYIKSTGRSMFIMIAPSVLENSSKFFQDKQLVEHYIKKEDLGDEAGALARQISQNYVNAKEPHDDIHILVFHGQVLALLGHLLTRLKHESGVQKIKLNMYDYMRNSFNYIDKHYCEEDLNLERIAEHIGISACYLSRCFKMYSGYTLTDYLNRKRISKAKKLLKETDKSIAFISLECGYGSLRNFNRVYKNITGNTPHEVRQAYFMRKDEQIKDADDQTTLR